MSAAGRAGGELALHGFRDDEADAVRKSVI
jgi:hypothetical protein